VTRARFRRCCISYLMRTLPIRLSVRISLLPLCSSLLCRHLPECIIGDLDSLRPTVFSYYASCASVYIRRDPDQNTTDLEKCVDFIHAQIEGVQTTNDAQFNGAPVPAAVAVTAAAVDSPAAGLAAVNGTAQVGATHAPDALSDGAASPSPSSISAPTPTPSPGMVVVESNISALESYRSSFFAAAASNAQGAIAAAAPSMARCQIVIYPAFGGRWDQQIAHINLLYKYALRGAAAGAADAPIAEHAPVLAQRRHATAMPMLLLSAGNSLRVLLPNIMHRIGVHPCLEAGYHAGLYPLCAGGVGDGGALTTTTGLQWDCDALTLRWGDLISTNNIIRSESREVTITADKPMVFTTEVRHHHVWQRDDAEEEDRCEQVERHEH
jgi:thiamine pyrophosphokinase